MTQAEVDALPSPARRCILFSGAVGRPRLSALRAHAMGELRQGPTAPWMHCEIWQYLAREPIFRLGHARLRFGDRDPVLLEDVYGEGRGQMNGHPFEAEDLGEGDGDRDRVTSNELARYLGDAILLAPSILLGPGTHWSTVDDATFDVELHDLGRSVAGRVSVDDRGAVKCFTAERFLEQGPVDDISTLEVARRRPKKRAASWIRARWSTPVVEWASFDGRRFARRMSAIWHAPAREFRCSTTVFDLLEFDEQSPDEGARASTLRL